MRQRKQIEEKLDTLIRRLIKSERKPKSDPEKIARNIRATMLSAQRLQLEVMLDMRDFLRDIRQQGKK